MQTTRTIRQITIQMPSPPPSPLNNFLRRILKFRTIIPSHLEFCTTEIVEFLANCLQRRSTVKLPLFVICSVRSFGPLRLLFPSPSLSSSSRLWLDWKKGWREGPFENCSRLTLSRSLSVSLSLCRSRIQPRHGSLTKSKWSKTSPVVSGGGPSLGSSKRDDSRLIRPFNPVPRSPTCLVNGLLFEISNTFLR